jgi:hypothetical protein
LFFQIPYLCASVGLPSGRGNWHNGIVLTMAALQLP